MYKQYKLGHYSVLHTSFCKDVFTIQYLSQPAVFEFNSDLGLTSSYPSYLHAISKVRMSPKWERPTAKKDKYMCAWIQNTSKTNYERLIFSWIIWLSKRLHAMSQKRYGGLQDANRLIFLLLQRTKAGFFKVLTGILKNA